jgi:glycosyltransferase involved in cell wall biosynthesis
MRFALILGLAPRKLGSLEEWMLSVARTASSRSHQLDVIGLEPIIPEIRTTLESYGSTWTPVDDLLRQPVQGVRQLRRYDAVHIGLFGVSSPIVLAAFAAWPVPLVYVDHFSKRALRLSLPARLRRQVLRGVAQSRVRMAVGVSEFATRQVASLLGLGPDRTMTIYNGVNLDRFESRPRSPREGDALTVLTVAHLIPEKGVDCLIRAAARLDWVHLQIIGDGPERRSLVALSETLGMADRIEFLGLRGDVERFLAACDVFVHPATWTEAFGLTVAEGMAAGCPTVASRTGAIPELIEHGRSGLLFPPGDVDALAEALGQLAESRALRLSLGARARNRAERLFDLERNAEQHVDLLERVAQPHGRRRQG